MSEHDRYREALEAFERALQLNPDDVEALVGKSRVLIDLRRLDDAQNALERALALEPDNAFVLKTRGEVLSELGRYEEAAVAFDRALQLFPDYLEALVSKGQILAKLGRYDEAVEDFNRALEVSPHDLEAHANIGRVLGLLGRFEEALEAFDRALILNPSNLEALVGKGHVLAELGRYEETRGIFHRVDQERVSFQGRIKDPDPVSLGFLIYGAVIASSSLVVAIANRVDTQRNRTEERERDEAQIRVYLGRVDRALNRLDEAYRSLVSVFDQQDILERPFSLGVAPIFADETLRAEIDRLRNTYFTAGKDLEEALDELSLRIGEEMQSLAQQRSAELVALFEESRASRTVARFMIDVGQMLRRLSTFVMQVGEGYRYFSEPARARQAALDATIQYLKDREPPRLPPGEVVRRP